MPTQAQQAQAEQEKNKKMQQEAALAIAILLLISRMVRTAKSTYAESGQIIDLNAFRLPLQLILRRSYEKTNTFFMNQQVRNLSKQMGATLSDDQKTQLRRILQAQADQQASPQAVQLLKTMQSDLNDIFFETQSDLKDQAKVAASASRKWKVKTNGRVNAQIVNTQVQGTAENAKNTTATFMLTNLGAQTAIRSSTKTWVTVGDDEVRPAHALADGQTVPIHQKYTVGGEKLSHPGDFAGSPGNINNCRCSSLTLFSK